MSYNTPAGPPPGWYPDPAGSPGQRWWNGTTWSESTQPVAPPQSAPQPYIPMQSHASAQPFASAQPYGSGGQQYSYYGQALRAPDGTSPSTLQIWIIAFWPLLNIVGVVLNAASGGYSMSGLYSTTGRPTDGLVLLIGALSWIGFILLALFDSQELKRRSVPRPFGWGWAFIPFFPIVYVIGRSVVVYMRTGKGLAPLWVYITCGLLGGFTGGVIAGVSSYLSRVG